MNNILSKQIENSIREAIKEFANRISEKYKLNSTEIIELWECSKTDIVENETSKKSNIVTKPTSIPKKEIITKPTSIPKKEIVEKVPEKKPSVAKSDTSSSCNGEGCPYLFTKGAKEGEYCGSSPKNGAVYCSRHKKYEGIEPKQKKVLPTSKKSIAEAIKNKKLSPKKEINIILRKHKILNQLWHQDTGMVFLSAKERVVIGKSVSDVLKPLDNDDIEVCKAHGFKYEIETNNEEQEKKTSSVTEESNPEEDLSDEDDEDEDVISSISHKITAVPSNRDKTQKSSAVVQRKAPTNSTKTLSASNATAVKKSISAAIATTNVQAKNVTDILGCLQQPSKENLFAKGDIEDIISEIKENGSDINEEFSEAEEEEDSDEGEYDQEIASDDELVSE
jgi:hypothetical protein